MQQNAMIPEPAYAEPSMNPAPQASTLPAEAEATPTPGLGEATALYTHVSCALLTAVSKEPNQATCPLRKANVSPF